SDAPHCRGVHCPRVSLPALHGRSDRLRLTIAGVHLNICRLARAVRGHVHHGSGCTTHHRPIPVAHRARGGVVGDHPRGRWGEPLRPMLTHPVTLIRRHRTTSSANNGPVVMCRRIVRVVRHACLDVRQPPLTHHPIHPP